MNPGGDIQTSKLIAFVGVGIVLIFVIFGYYLDYKDGQKRNKTRK